MIQPITTRELEILELISKGYSSDDIATTLFISKNTVKTHRKTLMLKLDATNSAQMVRIGFERGLLAFQPVNRARIARLSVAS